jgi:predicted nucleic acid-binding protein
MGSRRPRRGRALEALVDTNVLVRHLTGDPPAEARRASEFLSAGHVLLMTDVILAELVYVLSSYYERPRGEVARAARSLLEFPSIAVRDPLLLHRAIELFETEQFAFHDAYLVAAAERTGVGRVASFDHDLDHVRTIERIEP